jgi:hypothetical protein
MAVKKVNRLLPQGATASAPLRRLRALRRKGPVASAAHTGGATMWSITPFAEAAHKRVPGHRLQAQQDGMCRPGFPSSMTLTAAPHRLLHYETRESYICSHDLSWAPWWWRAEPGHQAGQCPALKSTPSHLVHNVEMKLARRHIVRGAAPTPRSWPRRRVHAAEVPPAN